MIEALESAVHPLLPEQLSSYRRDGYLVMRRLFATDEVDAIRQRFDALGAAGQPVDRYWKPDRSPEAAGDPLKRYPRVMQPHRWDELARGILLHRNIQAVLLALMDGEPVAAQTMFYFKPPGARGQALHQDNFYLQVKPGTCVAAWIAIDPATPENGGLYVVPGTQDQEIICPERASDQNSFTTHLVRPPPGRKAVPVRLEPGDTLFFNGSLIHGSPPNRSATAWRRSFISHYIPRTATHVSRPYFPLLAFDGQEVPFEVSDAGGPCGPEYKGGPYSTYGKDDGDQSVFAP